MSISSEAVNVMNKTVLLHFEQWYHVIYSHVTLTKKWRLTELTISHQICYLFVSAFVFKGGSRIPCRGIGFAECKGISRFGIRLRDRNIFRGSLKTVQTAARTSLCQSPSQILTRFSLLSAPLKTVRIKSFLRF